LALTPLCEGICHLGSLLAEVHMDSGFRQNDDRGMAWIWGKRSVSRLPLKDFVLPFVLSGCLMCVIAKCGESVRTCEQTST
jgi:hypothetical protein